MGGGGSRDGVRLAPRASRLREYKRRVTRLCSRCTVSQVRAVRDWCAADMGAQAALARSTRRRVAVLGRVACAGWAQWCCEEGRQEPKTSQARATVQVVGHPDTAGQANGFPWLFQTFQATNHHGSGLTPHSCTASCRSDTRTAHVPARSEAGRLAQQHHLLCVMACSCLQHLTALPPTKHDIVFPAYHGTRRRSCCCSGCSPRARGTSAGQHRERERDRCVIWCCGLSGLIQG